MKTYARIVAGVVVELITLGASMNASAMFAPGIVLNDVTTLSPQPQVGWTYSGGVYAAPAAPAAPSPSVQARMAKGAGCQIVSSSMSAISATYPVNELALGKMAVAAQLIVLNGNAFPAGVTSLSLMDKTGAMRTVTTATEYLALYVALAGYAMALDQIIMSNAGSLPAQPVTIA